MSKSIDRTSIHRRFVDHVRPATKRSRIVPVSPAEIAAAETVIGCRLPESYRAFVTQFGAGDVHLPGDAAFMLAEVWQPDWIVKQVNQSWIAPIPAYLNDGVVGANEIAWRYLTPFGSEQLHGYWFCFRRETTVVDDSPVFYFNHDGGDIEQIAAGFDDLIARLLSLPDEDWGR